MLLVFITDVFEKRFLNINVDNNDYHQRKTTFTFLYIKNQTNFQTFIYIFKNPDTLQKARQYAFFLIYKKPDTLRYVILYVIFEIGGGCGGGTGHC